MLNRRLGSVILALKILIALGIASGEALTSRGRRVIISIMNWPQKAMKAHFPPHDLSI